MTTSHIAHDIHAIDAQTFEPGITSVYLIADDRPTLLDVGAATSYEPIRDGIEAAGVAVDELQHIVLSHVHTDHSGAAGALVGDAPAATVHLHEATVEHVIDPTALIESTKRAMGEHFEAMGAPEPVPADRVVAIPAAGTHLDLGSRTIHLRPAPGHSPDHMVVWDPAYEHLFAAECLGAYLPRAERYFPAGTLPNFDIDTLERTIDSLEALDPDLVTLPHFGPWPDAVDDPFETARRELRRFDEAILDAYEETDSVAATKRHVGETLLDLAPPFDQRVEDFFANLLARGFLSHHGIG